MLTLGKPLFVVSQSSIFRSMMGVLVVLAFLFLTLSYAGGTSVVDSK